MSAALLGQKGTAEWFWAPFGAMLIDVLDLRADRFRERCRGLGRLAIEPRRLAELDDVAFLDVFRGRCRGGGAPGQAQEGDQLHD